MAKPLPLGKLLYEPLMAIDGHICNGNSYGYHLNSIRLYINQITTRGTLKKKNNTGP